MGRAGLERVKRLFSADQMVEKTLGVYRNLKSGNDNLKSSLDSRFQIPLTVLDGTSPAAGTPNPPARG